MVAGTVLAIGLTAVSPPRNGDAAAALAGPSASAASKAAANVVPIAGDYFFNWTRDSAITMSAVLSQAPAQIPLAAASELLASYVSFASVCQSSGVGSDRRSTRLRGARRARPMRVTGRPCGS